MTFRAFYGMDVSPASLLNGTFPRPKGNAEHSSDLLEKNFQKYFPI